MAQEAQLNTCIAALTAAASESNTEAIKTSIGNNGSLTVAEALSLASTLLNSTDYHPVPRQVDRLLLATLSLVTSNYWRRSSMEDKDAARKLVLLNSYQTNTFHALCSQIRPN
ncbi:hypothetical protein HDU99_003541, partial [Rhizoclosmatium hyalinum]